MLVLSLVCRVEAELCEHLAHEDDADDEEDRYDDEYRGGDGLLFRVWFVDGVVMTVEASFECGDYWVYFEDHEHSNQGDGGEDVEEYGPW